MYPLYKEHRRVATFADWEEGYAKHKAEMKGDADEQDNQ